MSTDRRPSRPLGVTVWFGWAFLLLAVSRPILEHTLWRGQWLVYQPVVRTSTGRITGVEALARWNSNGVDVPPDVFIKVAEESGLIVALGDIVLDRAAADAGICDSPTARKSSSSDSGVIACTSAEVAPQVLDVDRLPLVPEGRVAREHKQFPEAGELGDDLVPDYITSVKKGGFYGWPYAYFGQHVDPRRKGEEPQMVEKTLVPDVPLVSHSASLGLAFYDHTAFPEKYQGGAFIGQHGSWNRTQLVGYRVIFVPFENGEPSGEPEDFLTGFIADSDANEVYGRPVGITLLPNGSVLVMDDSSNTIWRVSAVE